MAIPITVVIAARNEAANIGNCIQSVRWADEILVVEDGSTDDTRGVAESAGATVLAHPFLTIGLQRNFAITRASSDWILVLDADERASPQLMSEVGQVVSAPRFDAYRIPRRNFFLGAEVRHGGWERDRPIRFFRANLRYNESRVHERVDVPGEIGELQAHLTHEPYATLDAWFEKLGRYSRWWAEDRFEKGKRAGVGSITIRPPLRFLTMFFVRGGWQDGARGAVLASLAATSVMAKYAQLWAKSVGRPNS